MAFYMKMFSKRSLRESNLFLNIKLIETFFKIPVNNFLSNINYHS